MTQANFSFISEAQGGDQFTVVNFSGREAISALYEYQVELKAPLSAAISLDDVLDSAARFITELDGQEFPVYGVLSNFHEMQTAQNYVHYRAVLVPRLWALSIYKTNEIYTSEKTIDMIIQTVLDNANSDGADIDYDLSGLINNADFLSRDYVCQFGESDFDFISRLMENEGIFYYFEHGGGPVEKLIFVNDTNYEAIPRPALVFDATAQVKQQHDCIDAWSCRKQRLAAGVTVRDFNPEHPSVDISHRADIDTMSRGDNYIYGENIRNSNEAIYLSNIRAEESLSMKTRYYGEGSVTRLRAGYLFEMGGHPNQTFNGVEYLAVEVNHEGQHLDMSLSTHDSRRSRSVPQYRNSFVAIEADKQFRPARVTPKPRFYGTMTAFIVAEGTKGDDDYDIAQVDDQGRYRVHLPFDRADGTMHAVESDRKASTWLRMVQPYVGHGQGMYFPLKGGTEVLLTFINGDPDQPVISGGLPNASEPSLLNSDSNFIQVVSTDKEETITGNVIKISGISESLDDFEKGEISVGTKHINEGLNQDSVKLKQKISGAAMVAADDSMLPPWTKTLPWSKAKNSACMPMPSLIKFKNYTNETFISSTATEAQSMVETDWTDSDSHINIDRGSGDNYVYANARTFAYPQHERVYFIGTFHEDFHVKDNFLTDKSWTGFKEQFNFPAPGEDFPVGTKGEKNTDLEVNPEGIRGVSEDKRWGDQMNYAWGRSFNWAGGPVLLDSEDKNGSFAAYNYGNSYTENLLTKTGGTSADLPDASKLHADDYTGFGEFQDKGLASASIEKTWGSVYSYQNGFSLDIKEGNSHEYVYGDKKEEVWGHAISHVHGSTHTTQEGAVSEMFLGAKNEFAWNYENAIHGGAATDFYAAAALEVFGGIKGEVAVAANFSLHLGSDIGLQLAAILRYTGGIGIDANSATVCDSKADLSNALAEIKMKKMEIATNKLIAKSTTLHLESIETLAMLM